MKGLSPVIATILMVAVAVAAAVLAYTWGVSFQSQSQSQVGGQASGVGAYTVAIESIDSTNKTVYVRNVGEKNIPSGSWALYESGTKCDLNDTTSDLNSSGAPSFSKGDVKKIVVSAGCSFTTNDTIRVTGPQGVSDQTTITST